MILALLASVHAGTLAGVTLPDTATVAGAPLVLNGLGLREKYAIDIYVSGLYLPSPTRDGAAAIALDAPKRVVMHFVYRKVTRTQIVDTFREGFGEHATGPHAADIATLISVIPEQILAGEQIVFDYAPGVGTTLYANGKALATVPGVAFMKLVFGMWLGAKPPSEALKAGMLGLG